MEPYKELVDFLRDDFDKLTHTTKNSIELLEQLMDAHTKKIEDVKVILRLWDSKRFSAGKATQLFSRIKSHNKLLLEKISSLEKNDLQDEEFLKEILGVYYQLRKSPPQKRYQEILATIQSFLQSFRNDLKSLKLILIQQDKYLKKINFAHLVSDLTKHTTLFHLFHDESLIAIRLKRTFFSIIVEFKRLPRYRKQRFHQRYSIREIVPPVPNELLQKVYDGPYTTLFPDEDERSDIDKLTRSLSQRYQGRIYHFFVLMCGNEPVGAIMFDYMTSDYKIREKRVSFGALWYIFVLEEHRKKGVPLIHKKLVETLYKDSLVRNEWPAGIFAEVNDPYKMTDEEIKTDIKSSFHPIWRQKFFRNNGYLVCDFDYSQPAEEEGSDLVEYLDLLLLPFQPSLKKKVPNEMMISMLSVFFKVEYFMDRLRCNQDLFEKIKQDILSKSRVTLNPFHESPELIKRCDNLMKDVLHPSEHLTG
ncbi:MAG: GNAT family N-acetyltransferase [Nanoarchaeota archaeon]|nr:GNAT family N-acetyltransferase [Nanoarchaeota archaeon]MBU1004681.1 GNAT family N-acetyltransferase [Nanoarchaeota archaeon]MBU1945806.1 GNAT family N-acetyltransferase [Nanoarchaeota archaeon]